MKNSVEANIQIKLYGKPVELNLSLPVKRVKPDRMLPVLQKITDKFAKTAVEAFVKEEENVSCKMGCAMCCRHPVPLAETEVYQIAELVEKLPETRRNEIKQRFAESCEKLKEIDWFERLENAYQLDSAAKSDELKKLAIEYFAEYIDCPFLEKESCTIYHERPLACREFLVTSPAENCQNPSPENIKHVDLKFKISSILPKLWKTESLNNRDILTMVYALEWSQKNPNRFPAKSGEEWLREFFNYFGKGGN